MMNSTTNTRRSIQSSNPYRRRFAQLDMYRKVPIDLYEGSKRGSIISWMALIIMILLAILETRSYFTTTLVKELSLDDSSSSSSANNYDSTNNINIIGVYFNITMMDLRCDFATIDVVSFLGKQQNVTKDIKKVALDARGVQKEYFEHRSPMQRSIELSDKNVKQTIEELHEDGEHAVPLDEDTFEYALNEYDFVYVDFYANWCSHCQIFAPTWEHLAELMDEVAEREVQKQQQNKSSTNSSNSSSKGNEDEEDDEEEDLKEEVRPAFVGKVDCVLNHNFCLSQSITGYPSIRLYHNGKFYGDYWGHRTILGLTQFLKLAEDLTSENSNEDNNKVISNAEQWISSSKNVSDEERIWAERMEQKWHHKNLAWDPSEHPGCQLSGRLLLDRTPGNFYIQAQSLNHDLNPSMTNVSHMVEYLLFSKPNQTDQALQALKYKRHDSKLMKFFRPQIFKPMDGNVYATKGLHEANHHYLKLISTNLNLYQVLASSQLTYYTESSVPEAKFIIDLSPIRVTYSRGTRAWYDFITSLMAILGGTFTVVGMLDSAMRILMTPSRRQVGKR